MNAVEVEEAVSELALQPFDRAEFPFMFLLAFGNKPNPDKASHVLAIDESDTTPDSAHLGRLLPPEQARYRSG